MFYHSPLRLLTGCGIMFIGEPVKEVMRLGIPARGKQLSKRAAIRVSLWR
jgi:hypothetical protein